MTPGVAANVVEDGKPHVGSSPPDSVPSPFFADIAPTSKICVVPSCKRRLRSTYEMKCRTCPEHRKAERVDSGPGAPPARFCQKCGRFHLLDLFEGPKRSCKDSLREHNQRQRRLRRLRLSSLGRSEDGAEQPAGSLSFGTTSSGGTPTDPALSRRFSAIKPLLDTLDIKTLLQPDTWGAAADMICGDASKGAAMMMECTDEAPMPPLDAVEDRLEEWSAELQGAGSVATVCRIGSGLLTAPSMPLVMLPNVFDVGPI